MNEAGLCTSKVPRKGGGIFRKPQLRMKARKSSLFNSESENTLEISKYVVILKRLQRKPSPSKEDVPTRGGTHEPGKPQGNEGVFRRHQVTFLGRKRTSFT